MEKGIKNKDKKIVFNEKVDDSINGFAVVFTFIIVGIILQFDNSFLGIANNVIKIIFIIIGILGFFTEVKKLNLEYNIKGLDNIVIGILLLIGMLFIRIYVIIDNWFFLFKYVFQISIFIIILLSIYAIIRGFIEMMYSILINYKKDSGNRIKNILKSIVVIITQLLGIVLIIAQIYNILK